MVTEGGIGGATVDLNTVLGKAVAVLYAFSADDHGLSLAELGRRTGLPKATLHRVVGDLVDVRLLDRTARGYRLSGRLFQLGMRASAERGLSRSPFRSWRISTSAPTRPCISA